MSPTLPPARLRPTTRSHGLLRPASPPEPASGERGAVTAEYAIATIAAVGFAALLVVVLRSDAVRGMLTAVIRHALSIPG